MSLYDAVRDLPLELDAYDLDVRSLDIGRIHPQYAGLPVDLHAVQPQQTRDDVDVGNVRDVAQHTGRLPQHRGDHRLGYEVLGPPYGDLSRQRCTAVDPKCG